MNYVICVAPRPRFARGAPVMIPVPRERVERLPPERLALALPAPVAPVEAPEPLPPVVVVASLPRAPLNLVAIERPTSFSAVLPTVAPILQAVSEATGYPVAALKATGRSGPIVRARQTACFVVRRFTGRSLPMIGQAIGGRDHTTVLHACRRVEALVALIGEPEADTVEGWIFHLLRHDWKTGKAFPR